MDTQLFKPINDRNTKVVATIGPATFSAAVIRELIEAGANVLRLNFSHGDHAQHTNSFNLIRQISAQLGRSVAVLQDLCGPKMRVGSLAADGLVIEDGSFLVLTSADKGAYQADSISVEDVNPVQVLKPGQRVLLADGLIELQTTEVKDTYIICKAVKGGILYSRQGIAFPDSVINLPATTAKDLEDLKWGLQHGVDYVALSFVANADDILSIRQAIKETADPPKIIAKIERREAIDNLEEIIAVSDAIMVARGDLGINLPLEQVPLLQKRMISLANQQGVPVIVATQMLRSMMSSIRPTRAEVSDVATAVLSGSDAVMLSEETAIGDNPVECVKMLDSIAKTAEVEFDYEQHRSNMYRSDKEAVSDSVAFAACAAASKIDAVAVVACSETGTTARLVAKYRPQQPLLGASSNENTLRRMALYWGVKPLKVASFNCPAELVDATCTVVTEKYPKLKGRQAVITSGLTQTAGGTSSMQIMPL